MNVFFPGIFGNCAGNLAAGARGAICLVPAKSNVADHCCLLGYLDCPGILILGTHLVSASYVVPQFPQQQFDGLLWVAPLASRCHHRGNSPLSCPPGYCRRGYSKEHGYLPSAKEINLGCHITTHSSTLRPNSDLSVNWAQTGEKSQMTCLIQTYGPCHHRRMAILAS
jgi:hypothetical protein